MFLINMIQGDEINLWLEFLIKKNCIYREFNLKLLFIYADFCKKHML